MQVRPVQAEKSNAGEQNAVHHHLPVKKQETDPINCKVQGHGDTANAQKGVLLKAEQPQDLFSASRAARGEGQAGASAAGEAADDTGGEMLIEQTRLRNRDQGQKNTVTGHTQGGLCKKKMSKSGPGQNEQGDIEQKVNDAGHVPHRLERRKNREQNHAQKLCDP